MSFTVTNSFYREIEGYYLPNVFSQKVPMVRKKPRECLILEPLSPVLTVLRPVVFPLYKEGERHLKKKICLNTLHDRKRISTQGCKDGTIFTNQ